MSTATETLNRVAPPTRHHRLAFPNCGDANAEIRHLETALGLAHGPILYNVRAANKRIEELSAMVTAKGAAPAVATAPPQPTGPSLATVCEIHSKIFGAPATEARLRNDGDYSFGREELAAANADVESARKVCGSSGPMLDAAIKRRADVGRRIKQAQAGNDADKIARLSRDFTKAGLVVPGLAAVGRPGDASTLFSDRQREFAQKQISAIPEN